MGMAEHTCDTNKNPTVETTGGVMAGYSFTAGYDNEDRLTSWNRANGTDTQTWNLSLVGDWNSTTINGALQNRTHNAVHELTAIGATPQTFDAKGNQLTDTQGRLFTWDIDNKMATANASAAGGSANISMTYDALGRRVSKSDGTTTTVFVCAGQQVVAEYAAGAAPASPNQSFVYGTYVDEQLMKVDAGNGNLYYHTNRLYCVTALTDSTGAVVERCAYAAYGVTTILDLTATTVRATSSVGNPYMYTGRRLDPEFASTSADALYYYRARYYDPAQGRFIGRDPLEYVDGMSMYEYVGGRVLYLIDWIGRSGMPPCYLMHVNCNAYPDSPCCGGGGGVSPTPHSGDDPGLNWPDVPVGDSLNICIAPDCSYMNDDGKVSDDFKQEALLQMSGLASAIRQCAEKHGMNQFPANGLYPFEPACPCPADNSWDMNAGKAGPDRRKLREYHEKMNKGAPCDVTVVLTKHPIKGDPREGSPEYEGYTPYDVSNGILIQGGNDHPYTLPHEIGHVNGLGHNNEDNNDIMNEHTNGSVPSKSWCESLAKMVANRKSH